MPTRSARIRWLPRHAGRRPQHSGIVVASGYGIQVRVDRRHLVVHGGIGSDRHEIRLAKATAHLKRLVVLGHAGYITLDAIRWLHDVNAALVQVGVDGEVLFASARARLDDARLRRAQAMAPFNGVGMHLVRSLITGKLEGQREILRRLQPDSEIEITNVLLQLLRANSVDDVRMLEAAGASSYWDGWSTVAIQWVRQDRTKVPEHWQRFTSRHSPITGVPRNAADPINAMLNYLYALLEAEARIACLTMGLDPGMGMLHYDYPGRDSLVSDVMEPVRPLVDRWLLQLLQERTFSARDFFETRDGGCRLVSPITERLIDLSPMVQQWVGPVVEDVVNALSVDFGIKGAHLQRKAADAETARSSTVATHLTGNNRIRGQAEYRRRSRGRSVAEPRLDRICRGCGAALHDGRGAFCPTCLAQHIDETIRFRLSRGHGALGELRRAGDDPVRRPTVRHKIGEANARRSREAQEWQRAGGVVPSEAEWMENILPGVRTHSLNELSRATGLSGTHCSRIRAGERIPHPRHWDAFRALLLGSRPPEAVDPEAKQQHD